MELATLKAEMKCLEKAKSPGCPSEECNTCVRSSGFPVLPKRGEGELRIGELLPQADFKLGFSQGALARDADSAVQEGGWIRFGVQVLQNRF